MQQHPLVVDASENGPLQKRIVHKLFVHKLNGLLARAVWDPRQPVSSIFKPLIEVLLLLEVPLASCVKHVQARQA